MKANVLRLYMLAMMGGSIFLLIALAVFETFPVTNGNNDLVVLQQANFQIARHEFLVKDVYALAYRPASGRAQAISELQIQLPAFQKVQEGLMNGDATLGLPPNPSNGVKSALISAQPDYLAEITAIKAILAHPDNTPDPIQVNIVAGHERPYIASMYPVVVLLQQETEARVIQLLVWKMSLIGLVVLLVILKYLLFTQKAIRKMIEEEAAQKEQPP